VHSHTTVPRDVGGTGMPAPPALGGAGLAEVTQAVCLSMRSIPLALRRCHQRHSSDRWAVDLRQSSLRHGTRVSPSNSVRAFSLFSALLTGSCPLALSRVGEPLTPGSPLHPSHLRWGCCLHYCGAPDAGGNQVQRQTVSKPLLTVAPCCRPPPASHGTAVPSSRPAAPPRQILPEHLCLPQSPPA
jgi:hypothetical protein